LSWFLFHISGSSSPSLPPPFLSVSTPQIESTLRAALDNCTSELATARNALASSQQLLAAATQLAAERATTIATLTMQSHAQVIVWWNLGRNMCDEIEGDREIFSAYDLEALGVFALYHHEWLVSVSMPPFLSC
jgi:hypothetical protein